MAMAEAANRGGIEGDDDLRDVIPDEGVRRSMLAELRPRGLAFFEEPISVFAGWPDAPCAYVKLSAAYAQPAETARMKGWQCSELDAGHFHMLVDPHTVADVMIPFTSYDRD